MKLPAGTTVYHGATFENIGKIFGGIKSVVSKWGEAELGPGFYAAVDVKGGAAYLGAESGGVIEFTTDSEMNGFAVKPPGKFDWAGTGRSSELDGLCRNHDFLVNVDDIPVSQYKFNYGVPTSKLTVVAVHLPDKGGWARNTKQDYLDLF